jgi:hypothetical protein
VFVPAVAVAVVDAEPKLTVIGLTRVALETIVMSSPTTPARGTVVPVVTSVTGVGFVTTIETSAADADCAPRFANVSAKAADEIIATIFLKFNIDKSSRYVVAHHAPRRVYQLYKKNS